MTTFDPPAFPEPHVGPHFLLGAASPFWAYYGAAAAGGMTYWWMTRWTQPMNLEAFFGAMGRAQESVVEAAEAAIEAVEAPLAALPLVGGEAAPISPLADALTPQAAAEVVTPMETVLEDVVEATAEPITQASPGAAVEAVLEPEPETTPEPVAEVAPETPFVAAAEAPDAETAPEPVVETETTSKPRGRKTPSAGDAQA